jgi:hypothetical protein
MGVYDSVGDLALSLLMLAWAIAALCHLRRR